MKPKHPGTNIIKQLPVSATVTYKMVESAVEVNKRRYAGLRGLYVKDRGETL